MGRPNFETSWIDVTCGYFGVVGSSMLENSPECLAICTFPHFLWT